MNGSEAVFGCTKMSSFQDNSKAFHIVSRSSKFENSEKINRYSLTCQELCVLLHSFCSLNALSDLK